MRGNRLAHQLEAGAPIEERGTGFPKPVYDERYSRPGLYWGSKPTKLARSLVRIAR